MYNVLAGVQVLLAVGVIFMVLLHSGGKSGGMSGAFGVGGAGGNVGGSLVESNLTKWTLLFVFLFVVNTIILLKL